MNHYDFLEHSFQISTFLTMKPQQTSPTERPLGHPPPVPSKPSCRQDFKASMFLIHLSNFFGDYILEIIHE